MWIATLFGKNVFHGFVNVGVVKETGDIGLLQLKVEERYGIKFEQDNVHSQFGYRIFDNATDDRDIRLVITVIDVID